MSREELEKRILEARYNLVSSKDKETIDILEELAIKALEQEPIEVEATKLQMAYNQGFEDCRKAVMDLLNEAGKLSLLAMVADLQSVNPQPCEDAISRKDVEECKELMTDINGDTVYAVRMSDIRRLSSVVQIPIECEDAISRQAVKAYKYHRTMYPNFEDYVDMLPSVNPQEPKYCDRNICIKNEYNGIGCDNTWKQARQEWESEVTE